MTATQARTLGSTKATLFCGLKQVGEWAGHHGICRWFGQKFPEGPKILIRSGDGRLSINVLRSARLQD
ncbi:MAG: hypothetical protein EOM44_15310 [Bacteroidia bacterium]|nr:hypothetical protein [Bacteroidia bacterium]